MEILIENADAVLSTFNVGCGASENINLNLGIGIFVWSADSAPKSNGIASGGLRNVDVHFPWRE